MSNRYLLALAEGVEVGRPSSGGIVIRSSLTYNEFSIKDLSQGIERVIDILVSTGGTEDDLSSLVAATGDGNALAEFYFYLMTLTKHNFISHGISHNDRMSATLTPISRYFRFSPAPVDPQSKYVLSRFAYLHRDSRNLILESPLAHGKVILHGRESAALIHALSEPRTIAELSDAPGGIPGDTISLFLEMFVAACFVTELKIDEPYLDENETLKQWDFHDLLFHARSRLGRHANPFGGTYRFHKKIAPLPVIKKCQAPKAIDLYCPDIDRLESQDYPFTLVLERRQSIREYTDRPITDRRLGEFLFRSARVKEILRMDPQDLSQRPYPGGGGIYELELYLSVKDCEGIPPGFYHYCPKEHRLEKISGLTKEVEALLKDGCRSTGVIDNPQILITIAARFQRFSWKYQSMAYNLILKNTGVLYQTMYLVATAMDLAPCALGCGDSDLFARAAGLDYYSETSVGEFLLGSKRTGNENHEK